MINNDDKNKIIRMFHVYKRYASKNAINDITLDINKGDFIIITGLSGAGKSTLLKLIYHGEAISEGQILIDGMNLSRISKNTTYSLRRKFGIIFQDFKLISNKSVYNNVSIVLEAMGEKKRIISKKVRSVLRVVGMEDKIDALPLSLSGGEQQRVAVARAVVGEPKIILADEPTGSLDSESSNIIFNLLEKFHSRGATIIVATHDKELISKAKAKIINLSQGQIQ